MPDEYHEFRKQIIHKMGEGYCFNELVAPYMTKTNREDYKPCVGCYEANNKCGGFSDSGSVAIEDLGYIVDILWDHEQQTKGR